MGGCPVYCREFSSVPVENHCVKCKEPDSKGYILYGPFICHSGKGKTGGTENSPLGYGVGDKKLITKGQ